MIKRVEASLGNKLMSVAHFTKFFLKLSNLFIAEVGFPVEGKRAVVYERLSWKHGVDSIGKHVHFVQVRFTCLAPDYFLHLHLHLHLHYRLTILGVSPPLLVHSPVE